MSMSDRVTIIRKGELIDTLNTKDIPHRRTCKSCGRNTSWSQCIYLKTKVTWRCIKYSKFNGKR